MTAIAIKTGRMKYLLYFLAAGVLLAGCKKEAPDLFGKSPDERLQEALDNFSAALYGAPGWKLFVYPKGLESQDIEVGGLTYYLRFPDSNRVTMVSDFTADMAAVADESGFRLKAAQRPSLVFDTYSYIHMAADPDEQVSFSPAQTGGYGWGTDFDFSFTAAAPSDTILLQGNFNKSDATLIRATQEEMDAAFNGGLATIMAATTNYAGTNAFLHFNSADNARVGVSFNLFLYRINFTWSVGGQLMTISAPFSHTTYGLHFKNPISVGGYTFQDLYWDAGQQVYYFNAGGARVDIVNASEPLFPFNQVLGRSISTISVPVDPLAGQSPLFADVYDAITVNLKTSGYNLDLGVMDFIFDSETNTMALVVQVFQNGVPFVLQYVYEYTFNSSNLAMFGFVAANGNGNLVAGEMTPLLNYINQDRFRLDYFTGVSPVLGQFTSLDHTAFFFTGNLR